jgi:hypothetical protein
MFQTITLMMEAASGFEKSVNYQITRRNNPEDTHIHTRRSENMKSHNEKDVSVLFTIKSATLQIVMEIETLCGLTMHLLVTLYCQEG